MTNRAEKSGFAAEAQRKVDANFDSDEARKCMEWMKLVGVTEVPGSYDCTINGLHEVLMDGLILCKLIDKLQPGKINWADKTFQTPKIQAMRVMRERERIAMFNKLVQEYGVNDTYTFPTESLSEKTNMAQVLICIRAIGIEAQSKGVGPEDYWPKKSTKNVRTFTDEQLSAGKSIVSLQYGSNAGASQAGMNMGKSRHIVD